MGHLVLVLTFCAALTGGTAQQLFFHGARPYILLPSNPPPQRPVRVPGSADMTGRSGLTFDLSSEEEDSDEDESRVVIKNSTKPLPTSEELDSRRPPPIQGGRKPSGKSDQSDAAEDAPSAFRFLWPFQVSLTKTKGGHDHHHDDHGPPIIQEHFSPPPPGYHGAHRGHHHGANRGHHHGGWHHHNHPLHGYHDSGHGLDLAFDHYYHNHHHHHGHNKKYDVLTDKFKGLTHKDIKVLNSKDYKKYQKKKKKKIKKVKKKLKWKRVAQKILDKKIAYLDQIAPEYY